MASFHDIYIAMEYSCAEGGSHSRHIGTNKVFFRILQSLGVQNTVKTCSKGVFETRLKSVPHNALENIYKSL